MATLMHDGGADIRDLQELLGHAQLSTTEIYTHVSIERLNAVHARTHPADLEPAATRDDSVDRAGRSTGDRPAVEYLGARVRGEESRIGFL